jgi:hypothetical protein
MTIPVFPVAWVSVVVATAAAARSTWSPCGLSMLSTITPISERAKGHSYRSTATWFVVGATAGGATLGAVMSLLAVGVHALPGLPSGLEVAALAAAMVAAVSDAGIAGLRLPIHRRQVNERWLDHYRPWVYGAGFGWQIGTGVATYITTAAVYLMIVLGALTGAPVVAFLLGALFGLLRGLAVLLTRNQTSPTLLRAFHRRFVAAGVMVGKAVVAIEFGAVVALTAVVRSPAVTVVVSVLLTLVACVAVVRRLRLRAVRPRSEQELVDDVAALRPLAGRTA